MKIKIGFGGILFLLCGFFSQDVNIFALYSLAAAIHETGHIAAAKILGIELEKLTLEVTGARLYPRRPFSSYREEWLLSAAGPCANIIAFVFSCVMLGENIGAVLQNAMYMLSGERGGSVCATSLFAVFSCLQAVLNLMPVSTLDGGRMFFCVTARFFGDGAAVRWVRISSATVAVVVWILAVYFLLKTGAGLSFFCFALCMLFTMMKEEGDG